MPWTKDDAKRHSKSVAASGNSAKWAKIANAVLDESGDEGKAIRIANAKAKKRNSNKQIRYGG